MKKTNVMRLLDQAKIPYTAGEYAYDEADLSGLHAAEELGLDPGMVFKTLVAKGDKTGYVVFSLPVNREGNLKKAAAASGNKKVEMLHVKDLQGVTGYIRGGCSPIGMKKKFPTFIDESIRSVPKVSISAGQRGCQVILEAEAYISFVEGTVCPLAG